MTKVMTPSATTEITDGQIDKATELYRAMLKKHRHEFTSKVAQDVLGQPEFVGEMVTVLRKRVEAASEMIVRRVKVNRLRSPQEAIDATGRKQYTDRKVVDSMPQGEGEEVDVYFFPLREYRSVQDVQRMLDERGLKPDPYVVSAVNEADPSFADEKPNGTQWLDKDGRHCCVAFDRWRGGRGVFCSRSDGGWRDGWWVGGVRK